MHYICVMDITLLALTIYNGKSNMVLLYIYINVIMHMLWSMTGIYKPYIQVKHEVVTCT